MLSPALPRREGRPALSADRRMSIPTNRKERRIGDLPMDEKTEELRDGKLEPKHVEGGTFPAVIHDLNQPLNQEDERETEQTPDDTNNQRRSRS